MSDQRELAHGGGICVSMGPRPNPKDPFSPSAPMTGLAAWWGDQHAQLQLTPEEVDWLISELESRRVKR